jgi:transmembrane sensor
VRRTGLFKAARRAATILAVVALGLGAARLATRLFEPSPEVYSTRLGQTSSIALLDGSQITLDTNSQLRVWIGRAGARRLELVRGRAFFKVAKDPRRPFIVRALKGSVTALGTAFDVREDADTLKVTLVEGKVRIKPDVADRKVEPLDLTAGYQYIDRGKGWQISKAATEFETSWVKGDLVFNQNTLDVIAEEVNRYTSSKIVIGDPAIGQERLSAILKIGDTDTLISAIQMLHMAEVSHPSDSEILLTAPK